MKKAPLNQRSTQIATCRTKQIVRTSFRLAVIGVKEEIAEVITKIIGRDITNQILLTTDNRDF